ncbi:Hypothetical predicted protein [Olea europaea subsp. europaea]|uniref:TLDc domain-containing protein n=1 Tax=Olea europaea subsp. europaea TaxID=158383 RepID=A0A8S0VEM5_OLEEU|nr:Hypothetical predicted protein [Olea europaea subsp. europaea]
MKQRRVVANGVKRCPAMGIGGVFAVAIMVNMARDWEEAALFEAGGMGQVGKGKIRQRHKWSVKLVQRIGADGGKVFRGANNGRLMKAEQEVEVEQVGKMKIEDIAKFVDLTTIQPAGVLRGKGLNRFWSNVEGCNGPLVMLIAAQEDNSNTRKWIIGVLINQGFENREMFYGNSGSLIKGILNVLAGKEKNFVYSHLHPTDSVYKAHPKPAGIAFGGSISSAFPQSESQPFSLMFISKPYVWENCFRRVGKTFLEVEVWGLGGKTAEGVQASYKRREEIFTQQMRNKTWVYIGKMVDLKTFANWEDSPEKMMMSNPNTVRREER